MSAYNDDQQNPSTTNGANAYKVDDDNNPTEKDLTKGLFGGEMQDADAPGMEAEGQGGHKFGENNLTPSGDDKNNPSQNAGYGNEYFKRSEPSQEVAGDNNFRPEGEEGYVEGTSDNDGTNTGGETGAAGYNEAPEQQKVGGATGPGEPGTADYKPEYDEGTPDYGSDSPDNK
ncbi:hypothetical protein EOD41_03840 [Mucilaginibacter limnophilus]|uniref:Uncharacterized protein n=1 Tax=Mucilaginibacter limnophilus TaxID=1932778 RepID=A0A437MZM8_9SPHI|nr:hypothetical protein [Mucilaginibacter limnophilus]RVU03074.1 hypothetical protein EOD41_03840 [Mucilaginibacter limnophilus]